jgi:hypothetical protein
MSSVLTRYINKLKRLVELERKAEIEAMQREMKKLSGIEREARESHFES